MEPKTPEEYLEITGRTAEQMVEWYGDDWMYWRGPLVCPNCGCDLRDLENGPPFKREIAIYSAILDITTHYLCPDCDCEFDR